MESAEEPVQDVEMDEVKVEPELSQPQLLPPEKMSIGDEVAKYHSPTQPFYENRLVFNPRVERSRSAKKPVCLLEDVLDGDGEQHSEGSNGLPSSKWARIDEYCLFAEAVLAYGASIDGIPDTPNTYAEVIASTESVEWRRAMNAVLSSRAQNHTWTFVPCGTAIHPIGCHCVFAKKRDENVRVIRYNARLVA